MTHDEDFSKLNTLLDEGVFGLSTSLDSNFLASNLKLFVLSSGWIHLGEQIVNEILEDLTILDNNLGQVEISEGSHKEFVLTTFWVLSLEATGLSQDGFDSSETPIIMDLLGEK